MQHYNSTEDVFDTSSDYCIKRTEFQQTKTALWNSMRMERFSDLSIINTEHNVASQTSFDEVIKAFAAQKARKIKLWGLFCNHFLYICIIFCVQTIIVNNITFILEKNFVSDIFPISNKINIP